jgi:fumarate hydratase class II
MDYRTEKDSLGEMQVPADALYAAQTQRAVENFPISDLRFPRGFIAAMGMIKREAARTNAELGLLEEDMAAAIVEAAQEVVEGDHDSQFPIDIFQTGSGTSTNMNTNEVIATLASRKLGRTVHPNDHVNNAQSSNDTIPTAMQIAARVSMHQELLPALEQLKDSLTRKAAEFDGIVKSGRTHLMDATPIRLGQELGGYASQVEHGIRRVKEASQDMAELPLGGTAVGTGINTHPAFAAKTIARLSEATGLGFVEAPNHFERQASRDTVVQAHGALNTLAVSLMKIANDLRWLASGPRAGLAEITLPATQPGSSIMPGKVNPVIPEAVTMVAAQVMGNHTTITVSGTGAYFELNLMMPIMAYTLLQSIRILANGSKVLAEKCVDGIEANEDRIRELLEGNLSLGTALAPHIGYDAAASLAKEAFREGKTVRELAKEKGVLPDDELDRVLDARSMTEPGIPGS